MVVYILFKIYEDRSFDIILVSDERWKCEEKEISIMNALDRRGCDFTLSIQEAEVV